MRRAFGKFSKEFVRAVPGLVRRVYGSQCAQQRHREASKSTPHLLFGTPPSGSSNEQTTEPTPVSESKRKP